MNKIIVLFLALGLGACATTTQEHLSMATLWAQNAGEARALSYQAFNIARLRLDQDLKNKSSKKRAVVVDVDETIVDNSPFQAQGIIDNTSYPTGWREWIDMANATALPGAVEFLSYADKQGVEVFYITNRKLIGFEPTYNNLVRLGFPVKKENMMLREKDSSKKGRREEVLKNHRIVLLMGDNLEDFSELFEASNTAVRNTRVDESKELFGDKFIVLPNAMYGGWEAAIYDGNMAMPAEAKSKIRQSRLRTMR